ncbi:sensor of ECF-type sigma factor [Winogradskyella sp. R77965]|uniref:sensor of ECF-type sigma factor n=1 Tax=Winogradskyella sp. R77965 TaxID=3093872 RepID=UPI0037DD7769
MKKIIPILVLLVSINSFAQRGGKMNERIKAQKTAFITEKLDLSSEEAEKFWPIYNAFEEKREKIKSEDLRAIKMQIRRNPDMSESEADKLLEKILKAEKELHTAKLKLVNDLKSVISSIKIIKLRAAEDEFNRILLEKLREMRQKRANRN